MRMVNGNEEGIKETNRVKISRITQVQNSSLKLERIYRWFVSSKHRQGRPGASDNGKLRHDDTRLALTRTVTFGDGGRCSWCTDES